MQATLQQYLAAMANGQDKNALGPLLRAMADRLSSHTLTTPGLAIKNASSALAKAVTAFYAVANGVLVTKVANTDMAALAGTVANARFNVYCFFIDSAGVLTSLMGTEGTTLARVRFPDSPQQKAMVGFVIVNPTGTGAFVGGTTNLDDGTVVPNAVYVNTLGASDPSVMLGI